MATRPFLDSHDAYAWALHLNGRDEEAAAQSNHALALGTRNALYHYHRGMIEKSLGHPDRARAELTQALDLNPAFHPLHELQPARTQAAARPPDVRQIDVMVRDLIREDEQP
ncbi:tetratricopeptide repeat protein [Kitasatospora sp. NPDC048365]|uniref:tetratricopeptide repeat protein n=1 Tax=Kitasatospora sp. NPDC048365 TaxID=3364050 RepID=UPI00371E0B4B